MNIAHGAPVAFPSKFGTLAAQVRTHRQSMSAEVKLDPRVTLLSTCLLSVATLWTDSVAGLALVAIFLTIFALIIRLDLLAMTKRFRTLFWFVAIITGVNAFTQDGQVLWEFSGFLATQEGFATGLTLSGRIILLLAASAMLVQKTSISDMIDSLEVLLRPIRRYAGPFIRILVIALHFVPLLIQTTRRIKMVQIARGADVETKFIGQIRFARSAAVPLFISALRSSDQLALAMDARGYAPSANRSYYGQLTMRAIDWFLLTLAVACCVVAFFI